MQALGSAYGWSLRSFQGYLAPVEGETSYEANALLKSRALFAQATAAGVAFDAVLADDSGLEVDALCGRPGVVSARYGGVERSWSERRQMLLRELDAHVGARRTARFICVVHLIVASGREFTAEAMVDGEIARVESGEAGFSYDPIFYYPPLGKTFAQLSEAEKNEVSHRALAMARLHRAVTAVTVFSAQRGSSS